MRILMGLVYTLLLPVFAGRLAHAAETTGAETVSYRREIEPIFRKHCFGCHQGAKQLGEYRMTDFSALVAGGESGAPAIVPGEPDESYLIDQITPLGGEAAMPKPPNPPLEAEQIELISRWIAEGANDDSPAEAGPVYDADHPPVYTGEPTLPSLDVSPDGRRVAIAGFHEVLIVDAASGELRDRLIGVSPRLNSVRFSPDGSRIAAVGGTPAVSGEVQIWDVEAGELLLSRQLTFDTLAGVSWSPDGSKLAFGAKDNVVRAIDSVTGEQVLFQGAHEDWVRDTVFTADGGT